MNENNYECFEVSIKENVAHIVLNRPEKRNCMSPAFWDELPAIVKDIDNNELSNLEIGSWTVNIGETYTLTMASAPGVGGDTVPSSGDHF